MAMILLNLDRKPGDGAHGGLEASRLEKEWQMDSVSKRLRASNRYQTLGIHLPDKEEQFGIHTPKSHGEKAKSFRQHRKTDHSSDVNLNSSNKAYELDVGEWNGLSPVQSMMLNYYKSCSVPFMGINTLYRKLRNNEVNAFRRVVVLSSLRQSSFAQGLDLKGNFRFGSLTHTHTQH